MIHKILMPSMGATMEEGTIIAWKVSEGDQVKAGDVLLEMETEKTTYDFESPNDGVVRKVLAKDGQIVPIQQLIAIIGDADEEIPPEWLQTKPSKEEVAKSTNDQPVAAPGSAVSPGKSRGIKISPRARKLAEKLGVDISTINGSGPNGRIESPDVEQAAQASGSSSVVQPISTIRARINRTVTESKQQIPHFYLESQVDMTHAMAYREKNTISGKKISVNAILMKAIVKGLEAEPGLNQAYSEKGYLLRQEINVGLAVETPAGVIIAVIDQVNQLGFPELSEEINRTVELAKAGSFNAIKKEGGCMTISNLGVYPVESFFPIIHPGESAILGVGSITERPVVQEGRIVARTTAPISLCVDHRIADGAVAARFLEAFGSYLNEY